MNCSESRSSRIWLSIALSVALFTSAPHQLVACQVEGQETKAAAPTDSRDAILNDQTRLAEQYRLLEEKLFSLYQYEQDQNPERSKLLQNAWQQSQEKLTLKQLESALQMLQQSRLRDAEKYQATAIENLEVLLELLQSGDHSKKLREDRDRYREYLKELERIERIQQGVRGRAEAPSSQNGDEPKSADLKNEQDEIARRTAELQSQIEQDRESDEGEPKGGDAGSSPESNSGDESNSDQNDGEPANPPPGENPLQKAQQHMEQARKALEEAGREKAVEPMRDAERELARAREELEKILRQLREEEIERSLASLESRFRQMMELQLRIQEETRRLDLKNGETRSAEVEMEASRLAGNERELVAEADRALLVLEDDGSSIATIESLRQVRTDLQQLADRLAAARTGETTQQIQGDVIEMLSQMIKAFEAAQNDPAKNDEQQAEGAGQSPGQQALIDQLAELKLVRSLQQRILLRHQRYAALLDDPTDRMGHSDEPDIREALQNLAERQSQLFKITRDIVTQQLRRQAGGGNSP